MSTANAATQTQPRIQSIDVLRGFALLGILLMNGQAFSMPLAAYFHPFAYGGSDPWNLAVQGLVHLIADQKFMALFSLLFGASVLLIIDGRKAKGLRAGRFHYARNFWLLLIGLAHGVLIWSGDILIIYAACSFLLYVFRNLRARWNLVLGLLCFLAPTMLYLALDESLLASVKDLPDFWHARGQSLEASLKIYRGGYADQLAHRLSDHESSGSIYPKIVFALALIDIPFRAIGMMLVGMALFRTGVLSGKKSPRFYQRWMYWGLGVGFGLAGLGLYLNYSHDWSPSWALGRGRLLNLWAVPPVAMGYIGLVMCWCNSKRATKLRAALAQVGRMALTNYILQSVLCTFVFYGFGLGLFGSVNRCQLLGITGGIWVLLIAFSGFWLKRFRYGPLEWLWRSLTYLKIQPLRR